MLLLQFAKPRPGNASSRCVVQLVARLEDAAVGVFDEFSWQCIGVVAEEVLPSQATLIGRDKPPAPVVGSKMFSECGVVAAVVLVVVVRVVVSVVVAVVILNGGMTTCF